MLQICSQSYFLTKGQVADIWEFINYVVSINTAIATEKNGYKLKGIWYYFNKIVLTK